MSDEQRHHIQPQQQQQQNQPSSQQLQRRHNCCRLCLAPDNECISILNSYAADKEPLASKIHTCVSVKVFFSTIIFERLLVCWLPSFDVCIIITENIAIAMFASCGGSSETTTDDDNDDEDFVMVVAIIVGCLASWLNGSLSRNTFMNKYAYLAPYILCTSSYGMVCWICTVNHVYGSNNDDVDDNVADDDGGGWFLFMPG
ncbi:hypothetical protein FF38_10701 [Lucilia cuprina]|uniref:Uncharacterized protein n=1 Tax=Lucilia cuprina TaxID=7375 RepID=A0A0L0CIE4_LUCCU|nr:hypothetical protein FF38_10701 [Lucilia cuprina]